MKILQSNIGGCGVPYKVTGDAKDNIYKPGTLGLLSYVKGNDMDYPNVVYFNVVTVRRGKGGKQRLDFNEVSFPVFNTENIVKLSEEGEYMPSLTRHYYVMMDTLPINFTHIAEMPGHDFLAWGCCLSKYLSQLRRTTNGFRMWPKDNGHIINVMSSMDDYMSSNRDQEHRDDAFERYTSNEMRDSFVRKVRRISSSLVQSHVTYKLRVAKMEYNAVATILENVKLFGVDKKVANNTLTHHRKKFEKINQLRDLQRRNKGKANESF